MTVAAGYAPTIEQLGDTASLGPFPTVWPYAVSADVQPWLVLGAGAELEPLTEGVDYVLAGVTPLINGGAVTLSNALLAAAA